MFTLFDDIQDLKALEQFRVTRRRLPDRSAALATARQYVNPQTTFSIVYNDPVKGYGKFTVSQLGIIESDYQHITQ